MPLSHHRMHLFFDVTMCYNLNNLQTTFQLCFKKILFSWDIQQWVAGGLALTHTIPTLLQAKEAPDLIFKTKYPVVRVNNIKRVGERIYEGNITH